MKAAALARAIERHNSQEPEILVQHKLVHTGQHYDEEMSGVFFSDLGLSDPDYELKVGSGPHGWQTGEMLRRLEPVLMNERPDLVIVYGDTNSTLAGALVASKLDIPIAHIEAGLRSWRREMPEEINRVVTDHLSSLLFAPSEKSVAILASEGILDGVFLVGDVMYDVLLWRLDQSGSHASALHSFGVASGEFAIATVHRPENADDPVKLKAILDALGRVASNGHPVLLPLHPRTRKALKGSIPSAVQVIPPLPYEQMVHLVANARLVLTDSGGLQKEAFWLAVPCVTLREETEWVETVESGWNILAGADEARILEGAKKGRPDSPPPPVYGHGNASERILDSLVQWASDGNRPTAAAANEQMVVGNHD